MWWSPVVLFAILQLCFHGYCKDLSTTPCDPMDCSTPGFPVLSHLLELAQTHVQWVGDAIQPSIVPFFSCLQSFPALGSFLMSQLFASLYWDATCKKFNTGPDRHHNCTVDISSWTSLSQERKGRRGQPSCWTPICSLLCLVPVPR